MKVPDLNGSKHLELIWPLSRTFIIFKYSEIRRKFEECSISLYQDSVFSCQSDETDGVV